MLREPTGGCLPRPRDCAFLGRSCTAQRAARNSRCGSLTPFSSCAPQSVKVKPADVRASARTTSDTVTSSAGAAAAMRAAATGTASSEVLDNAAESKRATRRNRTGDLLITNYSPDPTTDTHEHPGAGKPDVFGQP